VVRPNSRASSPIEKVDGDAAARSIRTGRDGDAATRAMTN
jgi:hypothetical protein